MTLTSKFDEIQQRAAMVAPMPITLVDSDLRRQLARKQRASTRLVDETLEDSFPASDPPSWTFGVARVAPINDAASNTRMLPRLLHRIAALF
jgi:hypothetical protein